MKKTRNSKSKNTFFYFAKFFYDNDIIYHGLVVLSNPFYRFSKKKKFIHGLFSNIFWIQTIEIYKFKLLYLNRNSNFG